MEEETGLPAGSVTIEAILPDWVTYDLPDHRALEQITRQFTLAESAMAVLREAGMVGNTVAQIKATKPAKREVQMHLCAQPPL